MIKCPICKGRGICPHKPFKNGTEVIDCEFCNGTGKILDALKICGDCNGDGGHWEKTDSTNREWVYCDKCNGIGREDGIQEIMSVLNLTAIEDARNGKPCAPITTDPKIKLTIYQRALNLWGEPAQLNMAIEECAELIKKLVKLGRFKNGSDIYKVADEIADVEIMLEQLRYIFGNDMVNAAKKRKLERLEKLVKYGEGST